MDFFGHFGFEKNDVALSLLEKAKADDAKYGDAIYDFEKYGIFTYTASHIKELADEAKKDKMNRLYCYFLARVLESGNKKLVSSFSQPKEKGVSELYDFLPMFGILRRVEDMISGLNKAGVDPDVVYLTKNMFENQLGDFVLLNHRYGISDYVTWLEAFLENRIIRIGRFNFERRSLGGNYIILKKGDELVPAPDGVRFHRSGRVFGSIGCDDETGSFTADLSEDEKGFTVYKIENGVCKDRKIFLPKPDWEVFLTPESKVIDVHIPTGGPLVYETDTADFIRAFETFNRCFGGGFKAFHMHSWLLEPLLPSIMGRVTNLTRFSDRFTLYPAKSGGEEVFEYLYNLKEAPDPATLEENSSFRRAVKKFLLEGNHFYGGNGVMLPIE